MTPDQRVIGREGLVALLRATTMQRGSLAVIMAKYLFPAPRR